MLSTPTHTPAYIQTTELIRRLSAYQETGTKPCPWDFQLAIARCAMENEQLLQRLQEWATNSNLKKVTTSLNRL